MLPLNGKLVRAFYGAFRKEVALEEPRVCSPWKVQLFKADSHLSFFFSHLATAFQQTTFV